MGENDADVALADVVGHLAGDRIVGGVEIIGLGGDGGVVVGHHGVGQHGIGVVDIPGGVTVAAGLVRLGRHFEELV